MAQGELRIGTAGWHYAHWVGPFYPPRTASEHFLAFYAERFDAVEINATFYRLPTPETLSAWREATPKGFSFACKASRYITHMKKLKDPEASTARFFSAVDVLGAKLGPILFQLSPRWHLDLARLEAFLEALPKGYRFAFEFRDATWFAPEVYRLLARHNAAFCIYDLAGRTVPREVTADLVYIRLHGPKGPYEGRYHGQSLRAWARRLTAWADEGHDVHCYFDNDEKGYAAEDARRLRALLEA